MKQCKEGGCEIHCKQRGCEGGRTPLVGGLEVKSLKSKEAIEDAWRMRRMIYGESQRTDLWKHEATEDSKYE